MVSRARALCHSRAGGGTFSRRDHRPGGTFRAAEFESSQFSATRRARWRRHVVAQDRCAGQGFLEGDVENDLGDSRRGSENAEDSWLETVAGVSTLAQGMTRRTEIQLALLV